jgi:hypothetical protein
MTTIFILGNVFAEDTSAIRFGFGAGGFFTSDFGGGVKAAYMGRAVEHWETPNNGGGGYFFFDFEFLEFTMGAVGANGTWDVMSVSQGNSNSEVSYAGADISLFAKYPFEIHKKILLFPLLGISLAASNSAEIDIIKENYSGDNCALWLKGGLGFDYYFNENIFLRCEALYGFRFTSIDEEQLMKYFSQSGANFTENIPGHGLTIRLSIGLSSSLY